MKRITLVFLLAMFIPRLAVDAQGGPYRFVKEIAIGGEGGWDFMVDATNGKVLAQVPIGTGTDSSWYDPGSKLAFSSTGEGTVTVAREASPTAFTTVQTLATRPFARTMTLDPSTHRIYLAVSDFEAPTPGQQGRPKALTGTFRVLVYEMVTAGSAGR